MKKVLVFLSILMFSLTCRAQLRAYTFDYNDEFGGKQKCYLTLRSIVAEWDNSSLNVVFNCYESAVTRQKKISPRKSFIMDLRGADFLTNVTKPIDESEIGTPRAVVLSNWAWDIALTFPFIDDFVFDDATQQMKSVKKSLTDLHAVRVDVSLNSLAPQLAEK